MSQVARPKAVWVSMTRTCYPRPPKSRATRHASRYAGGVPVLVEGQKVGSVLQ